MSSSANALAVYFLLNVFVTLFNEFLLNKVGLLASLSVAFFK
jgi:hypothetical protein